MPSDVQGQAPTDPVEVVRTVVAEAILRGVAPGDVVKEVAALCAEERRAPCEEGQGAAVVVVDQASGIISRTQLELGADRVLTVGPAQLTIRQTEEGT